MYTDILGRDGRFLTQITLNNMNHKKIITGIFWVDLDSCKVYSYKTSKSVKYGDNIICPQSHYSVWEKIISQNPKWYKTEYEDTARGRIFYNLKTRTYYINVCPLVRNKRSLKKAILNDFGLDKNKRKYCFLWDDTHYVLPAF
jgi:hypothetical protein